MAGHQYHVLVKDVPEKNQTPTKINLLARLRARPWLSAGLILLLLGGILALILGLVLGLRGSSSNSAANSSSSVTVVSIPSTPPATSFAPLQPNFVSFAIEYAFLPEFAGNTTNPNLFSYNILSNIANISGSMPYIRVGGDSADFALYDPGLSNASITTFREINGELKFGNLSVGPVFFESFSTWPDVKFIVGLNLKNATSSTTGMQSMLDIVAASCSELDGKLLWWEYGNEPDRYHRPSTTWNSTSYVRAWKFGATKIKETLQEHCPDMASAEKFGFVGPSLFASEHLPPGDIITAGYNEDGLVKEYAMHHFMADCAHVACSQQSMLMNHTYIKSSLAEVTTQIADVTNALPATSSPAATFVLDEISMFLIPNAAPAGTSDTFGAALWALDFSLYCASIGISRTHMQQGIGFSYNAWSPVDLGSFSMDVYPIYYGNVAAASALGNFTSDTEAPRVVEIDLPNADEFEAAYAIYQQGKTLSRIVVLNLAQFNGTSDASQRSSRSYQFSLPASTNGSATHIQNGFSLPVARLTAAGADSKDGVTYNGYSYQYDLAQGKAAKVDKSPPEMAVVANNMVQVSVPDSSAVLLDFQSGSGS